jgi:hypothetical protein
MMIALYPADNEETNTVEKCAQQCANAAGCGHFNFGIGDRANECRMYWASRECDPSSSVDWVYYKMISALKCKEPARGYFLDDDGVAQRCTASNAWYRCPTEVNKHRPAELGGLGP